MRMNGTCVKRLALTVFFLLSLQGFAYTFSVEKVGRKGTKSESKGVIFADKSGTQSFRLIIRSGVKEPAQKFSLSGITIVKANMKRKFQFAFNEIGKIELESIPGASVSARYVTCKTSAVDDNWKDVEQDMSRGLVVVGATIEVHNDKGKRVFVWSNQAGVYKKGIDEILSDKETKFQNTTENKEHWKEYLKGQDDGWNYWRTKEDD